MARFSFRQAELFFLGRAEALPAPLGRSPVTGPYLVLTSPTGSYLALLALTEPHLVITKRYLGLTLPYLGLTLPYWAFFGPY